MKKFLNIVKFFAISEGFWFSLMSTLVMGTVAVYALTLLYSDGYDLAIAFNAIVFALVSFLSLVVGIRETASSYKMAERAKYYEHLDNMVKSGEWARI